MEIFIGRQPILDKSENINAYEILFRNGDKNFAPIEIGGESRATNSVLLNTFYNMGVDKVIEKKRGFVNFDSFSLMDDEILNNLPKDKIVIEILETVEITKEVVARCRELKERGFTLAIDDVEELKSEHIELFDIIDIIKVDIMNLKEDITSLTKKLQNYKVELLAEKVETKDEFELCKELGYSYFQGYFFAKPVIIKGKELSEEQSSILRVVNLIKQGSEIDDVIQAFKQSPKLTIKLIKLLNSGMFSFRKEITSIRQAITLLGVKPLEKWLIFLLYLKGDGDISSTPISELISSRSKMMELIEQNRENSTKDSIDTAFTVGLLSLIDTVLGVSKEDIFENLSVTKEIKEAVIDKKGYFGELLEFVELLENKNFEDLVLMLDKFNISINRLNQIQKNIFENS